MSVRIVRPPLKRKVIMDTMVVLTCKKCRGWYSMGYKDSLDDDHFDMRTGEPCNNLNKWNVQVVPCREDWQYAR